VNGPALLALVLLGSSAWAAMDPPNTAGCREKFDQVACRTDQDEKGTCINQMINTPDFSQPGPPKFKMMPTMVCVAAPVTRSIKDYFLVLVSAVVIFGLVIYNLFRRKTLSDYL
jgi:hypothetical protein